MKDVGVREFRDHASRYLSGDEPLAVRRHGRVLGVLRPCQAEERYGGASGRAVTRRKARRIFVARQAFPKRSWSKNSYLTRCRN